MNNYKNTFHESIKLFLMFLNSTERGEQHDKGKTRSES